MTLFGGIEPGTVVRVKGLRGLYRAVEPSPRNPHVFWFLPCNPLTQKSGWRAFRLDRITPVKKPR